MTEPTAWTAETLQEVALFCGVAEATVRAWRISSPPMPGEPGRWHLPSITQWRLDREKRRKPMTEDEAMLEIPGNEDWKERWVRSKALIGELQLQVQHGDLVAVEDVWPRLQLMAEVIRAGLNKLEAEYGRQAADIVRTPLERMQEELEAMQVDTGAGTDD